MHLCQPGPDGTSLRNALGLIIQPRGGSPIEVCGLWDEPELCGGDGAGLDRRLTVWQQAFADGALADSTGYQLKMLAEELEGEPLASEAKRLVSRRGTTGAFARCSETLPLGINYLRYALNQNPGNFRLNR
ncbi:MAG: hypothetical protein ACRERU_02450 [Methylococcales bacterium]